MADNVNLILQILTLVVAGLLLVGSITWFAPAVIDCPKCPTCPEIELRTPVINLNLTSLEEGIADIQSTLDEDESWENEAEALATEEWEENDYKDIYKAINNLELPEIDDRDDIDYVSIKDTRYSGMDADDEDATVEQDVKVKYEDVNGDTRKVYLTITTEIVEGEIEDQNIVETD